MAPSHADPTQTTQQTAKLAETERTEKLAPTGPAEAADPKLPTAKSEGKMKKERGGPGAREKRRQIRKDEFQADADKTAKSTAPEEAETLQSYCHRQRWTVSGASPEGLPQSWQSSAVRSKLGDRQQLQRRFSTPFGLKTALRPRL